MAYNKGIVSAEDLDGLAPRWGHVSAYLELLDKITDPPNEFFQIAGQGVKALAERYGGKEFAVHFEGNEATGYHTGPANIVGHLVGIRHSHLDNAGYSIDQKALAKSMTNKEMGRLIAEEDTWRSVLNSLVICLFARPVFTPEIVLSSLKALGEERTADELQRIGEEVFHLRMKFKTREGYELDNLTPPPRLLERLSPHGRVEKTTVEEIIHAWRESHKL